MEATFVQMKQDAIALKEKSDQIALECVAEYKAHGYSSNYDDLLVELRKIEDQIKIFNGGIR